MVQKKNFGERLLQSVLGGMLAIALLYMIIGECIGPRDVPYMSDDCRELPVAWERVYPDGRREAVTLPGVWDAERKELVRAEAVLPDDQETIWGCIRASQQDVRIYVDGQLREQYSTKDTRMFGRTSASVYVLFPLFEADAGRVLAIETESDSVYSGRMNQVIVGDKSDIVTLFIKENSLILTVAFTAIVLSIVTLVASLIVCTIQKKETELFHLSLGTLMTSLIMVTESLLRQFMFPNITIASNMGFLLTMLAPYPFLIYANKLQKRRYQKFYTPILICVILNTLGSTVLHILGIVDFLDSMIFDYIIIGLALAVGAVTIITDLIQKRIKDYGEVAIGLIGIIAASVWEIYQVYYPGVRGGGFAFCAGLCFLLGMAVIKTGRDMLSLEKERQRATLAGEAKTQFLAQMSHEIRTPINTIIGMNEMILRESENETIRGYAENIRNSSRLLMGLVNDVLDFSKIEAGKLDVAEARYSLKDMLAELSGEMRFRAEKKNLKLETQFASDLPLFVRGDELRIRQILLNLLSNAVKYTKEGQITFSVWGEEKDGFCLCASVKDTGIGIRKEDVTRLFDSFQRVEERKNRHIEGTGLGLAITKQLLDVMGGSIAVESEYGKGSCFTISVPQKIDEEADGKNEESAFASEHSTLKEKKLSAPEASVLAVDDNAMNLAVIKALLKRTEMYVDTAMSGSECLELCKHKKYDLILMDHMMPEPDGIETLHLLRKEDGPNRETEVLVLTANAIAGMEEQYKREGFADYLSKPLVVEDLEAVLAKHLPQEKVHWQDERKL